MQLAANRKHLCPIVIFLTIPVIFIAGGALFVAIDPEKLAGHTNYVRNFQLLTLARSAITLAMFGSVVVAWFVACLLVLRSKSQPYRWLLLALLGPIGLAVLASLRDLSPDPFDIYERFNRKLNAFLRSAYETSFFILAWTLAWQMMLIKREAMIAFESAMTGLSRDQVLEQENMQSAMWAFSELNEVMYFFALLYLLRPVCINVLGSKFKHPRSSEVT